jgi:transposase
VAPFQLRPHERRTLSLIAGSARTGRELTRAQALLWLDEGETVEEVAQRLLVSRQTVYNWLLRFRQRSDQNLRSRLQDAPRAGRPPTALGIIDPLLEEVIDTDPRDYGYRHTVWTAALLQHYLREAHGIIVGRRSIGLAIARLGVRWKRPRHVLGQRPDTWRQAKGG